MSSDYYFNQYLIYNTISIVKVTDIRSESIDVQDRLGRYKKEELIISVQNIRYPFISNFKGDHIRKVTYSDILGKVNCSIVCAELSHESFNLSSRLEIDKTYLIFTNEGKENLVQGQVEVDSNLLLAEDFHVLKKVIR